MRFNLTRLIYISPHHTLIISSAEAILFCVINFYLQHISPVLIAVHMSTIIGAGQIDQLGQGHVNRIVPLRTFICKIGFMVEYIYMQSDLHFCISLWSKHTRFPGFLFALKHVHVAVISLWLVHLPSQYKYIVC